MMDTINALLSGGGVWILAGMIAVGGWIVRGHYDNKSEMRQMKTHMGYLRRDVDRLLRKVGLNGGDNE